MDHTEIREARAALDERERELHRLANAEDQSVSDAEDYYDAREEAANAAAELYAGVLNGIADDQTAAETTRKSAALALGREPAAQESRSSSSYRGDMKRATLSPEARRLIGAMLATTAELTAAGVNDDEMPAVDAVIAAQAAWDEVRAAFPFDPADAAAHVCEGFLYIDDASHREALLDSEGGE